MVAFFHWATEGSGKLPEDSAEGATENSPELAQEREKNLFISPGVGEEPMIRKQES